MCFFYYIALSSAQGWFSAYVGVTGGEGVEKWEKGEWEAKKMISQAPSLVYCLL